jgi:two-component sensor histidine kinase
VITNTKHAFKGKEKGKIWIELSQENDLLMFAIKDNGCGLPSDFDMTDYSKSLGLKLINTLTHQLEGTCRYESSSRGTTFFLEFKKAEKRGAANAHLE